MAQLNYHPAPGLGDLLPGFYVVPQNPFEGATYIPRIGEILPGHFTVPQNPIKDYMSGRIHQIAREPGAPGMLNGKGIGECGCGGSCGGCGSGVGDISADLTLISDKVSAGEYMAAIQSPVFGFPLWGIIAAVVAIPMLMKGGR